MSGEHATTIDPRRLPNPGEPVPSVAWPTVGLFAAALALFAASTTLALEGAIPAWLAVGLNAISAYMHFTVLHDALHRSTSQHDWINTWLGRISGLFVAPPVGVYPVFRYVHMQHHRFTNHDRSKDPDAWAGNGPAWTWPLRWATLDLSYVPFYLQAFSSRPAKERIEGAITVTVILGALVAFALAGYLVEALVYWILPSRFVVLFLGFAFDWLPHHGLHATPEEDRYKTTRNRIGFERIASPVLLYQNYHLVHHLHPLIPFYRYIAAWRRNEDAYLAHEPPLTTVTGKPVSVEDYRSSRSSGAGTS